MTDDLPRVLAIVGPTAAGKHRLGIEAAQRIGAPVLVCDSVKVYRGLDIGSAKPTAEHRCQVPHRLVDLVDPDRSFSAGDYAQAAWDVFRAEGGVIVGGTGFYLRAFGWTDSGGERSELHAAPGDPRRVAFEDHWEARERSEPGEAHRALTAVDPETAGAIHPHNLRRILRALWMCEILGEPVSALRRAHPPAPRARMLLVVCDPGADALDVRIQRRLDAMFHAGWLDEVERLMAAGYDERHKAMRSLGYRQLMDVVRGRSSEASAREAVRLATRHYARRQRTYFRHQLPADQVLHISDPRDCPWARIDAFLGLP